MTDAGPERTFDLEKGLWYVDVRYHGVPRLIATAVMETPAGLLLVDPGPSRSADNLLAALQDRGHTLSDVSAILLTHIHLDHAGATGTLVARNRRIRVYVHRRGARHIVDPSRLLRSAKRIYGDEMDALWGEVLPVPEDRVEAIDGGEIIGPGGREIEVRYTPGHAIHHVTYFDRVTRTAFVGDTTGMRVSGLDHLVPVTPPPDIDVPAWKQSLSEIRNLDPRRLFLTHFGPAEEPAHHIESYDRQLESWLESVRLRLRRSADVHSAARAFRDEHVLNWRDLLKPDDALLYERFADPAGSFLGLARYLERTGESDG